MTCQGREVGSKAEVPGGQKQQFGGKTFKMHTLRLQEGTSFPHLRSDRREQLVMTPFLTALIREQSSQELTIVYQKEVSGMTVERRRLGKQFMEDKALKDQVWPIFAREENFYCS